MLCPKCNQEVDQEGSTLLNPKRDKVKHPKALHICPGKPVAASVREKLTLAMPGTKFEIVELIFSCLKELQDSGAASYVADSAALIPVLAQDMKRKAGGTGSDESWMAAAKSQIEGNRTTALTTSDDRYTGIEGGEKFDEVHELVHICSGPGGESPQHNFKLQFNEGAINYFAELVAPKLGATAVVRYKTETDIVKKCMKMLGGDGNEAAKKLFGSTFQGKIDDFFLALGDAFRASATLPNGKPKGFSEKGWTAFQAQSEFKSKAQNWSTQWLDARLPAL